MVHGSSFLPRGQHTVQQTTKLQPGYLLHQLLPHKSESAIWWDSGVYYNFIALYTEIPKYFNTISMETFGPVETLWLFWLPYPLHSFFSQELVISHVRNEQGTGYEYSILIELKNEPCHLKEHPKISLFTKFDCYWFKRIGMTHF